MITLERQNPTPLTNLKYFTSRSSIQSGDQALQNERSQHTLSLNCAMASLCFHWTVSRWPGSKLCVYVCVCGGELQQLASHFTSETANVSFVNRKQRIGLCYTQLWKTAKQKDTTFLWARRGCLSRLERDEDDTTVVATCVSVASCCLLVS